MSHKPEKKSKKRNQNGRNNPNFIKSIRFKHITIKNLITLICQEFNLELEHLQMGNRKREYVEARQITCYLVRKHVVRIVAFNDGYEFETKVPYDDIGKILRRHHATIMYSERQAKNFIDTDLEFKKIAKRLNRKIRKYISTIQQQ